MRIDITSLCFGFKIKKDKDSGTPAWCTSLGQAPKDICYIKEDRPGLAPILSGMLHMSHCDFENLTATALVLDGETIKGPTSDRERMMFAVFDNVYVNNIKIAGPLTMTFEREKSASHNNRFQICYARYLSYKGHSNAETYKNAAIALECDDDACWFVYDISIKHQDTIFLSAIIVDHDKSCEYADSKERARLWNLLLDETCEFEFGEPKCESQIIYYGAPGTGKSYKIENEILKDVPEEAITRVTFYPDYYYSDFIGGLKPRKSGDDITYEFTPGPFAKALERSFISPTYLIIEEINRGNPAAIFGDIFQLLDRRGDGRSRYEITNKDLYEYLSEDVNIAEQLSDGKIFIPEKLHILCTMNTADQNVFVLDTAFKRRFRMEYVPIDFTPLYKKDELAEYIKTDYDVFNGSGSLKDIFTETGVVVDKLERNWPTFAAFVNAEIDEINADGIRISEDKKLGPFFVGVDELKDRRKFADKVLYYLKQDVFKYEDVLKESYEDLYDKYVNGDMDIFTIFSND